MENKLFYKKKVSTGFCQVTWIMGWLGGSNSFFSQLLTRVLNEIDPTKTPGPRMTRWTGPGQAESDNYGL
jgi:hypothetical protein